MVCLTDEARQYGSTVPSSPAPSLLAMPPPQLPSLQARALVVPLTPHQLYSPFGQEHLSRHVQQLRDGCSGTKDSQMLTVPLTKCMPYTSSQLLFMKGLVLLEKT